MHAEETMECDATRETVLPLIAFAMVHGGPNFSETSELIKVDFESWLEDNWRLKVNETSISQLLCRFLRGESNAVGPEGLPWCVAAFPKVLELIQGPSYLERRRQLFQGVQSQGMVIIST
jgi:hypothetical protein